MRLTSPGETSLPGNPNAARFFAAIAYYTEEDLPLLNSLDKVAATESDPAFHMALATVKAELQAGSTFADALAKHPQYFDNAIVHMVKNAELCGIPERIFPVVVSYCKALE